MSNKPTTEERISEGKPRGRADESKAGTPDYSPWTPSDPRNWKLERYAVCTPYFGNPDLGHIDCYQPLRRRYDVFRTVGCPYIDQARAALCKMAENHAGVFFIDHDIHFHADDVERLIEAAMLEGTVVAGIYSERRAGKGKIIGCFDPSYDVIDCFARGGLYDGVFAGLGFCAIPRHVLEAVGKNMPRLRTSFCDGVKPLFLSDISTGQYGGEDTSFFKRVRDAGFKPLLHTAPRLGHVGSYVYHLEDVHVAVPRYDWLRMNATEGKPAPVAPADAEIIDPATAETVAPAFGSYVAPPPRPDIADAFAAITEPASSPPASPPPAPPAVLDLSAVGIKPGPDPVYDDKGKLKTG